MSDLGRLQKEIADFKRGADTSGKRRKKSNFRFDFHHFILLQLLQGLH